MTKDKSRIQSCVDHINTAVDVDPWAKELVAEMGKEILEQLNNSNQEVKKLNDCISRADAIDAVANMLRRKFGIGGDLAEITIAGSPSAQPEIMSDGTLHITVSADVANIDRILLSQEGTHSGDLYYKDAQPEIVRCKDCRWQKDQSGSTAWLPCRVLVTPDDFYCGRAERRTDGVDS